MAEKTPPEGDDCDCPVCRVQARNGSFVEVLQAMMEVSSSGGFVVYGDDDDDGETVIFDDDDDDGGDDDAG
jgi:hypothetical protein